MTPNKIFLVWILILVGAFLSVFFTARLTPSGLDASRRGKVEEFRAYLEKHDLPNEPSLPTAYLHRFLKLNSYIFPSSLRALREDLAWREASKIHSILEEDWTYYEQKFPYDLSNITDDGYPILFVPLGTWNVCQEGIPDYEKLLRYASIKMLEDAYQKAQSTSSTASHLELPQFTINFDLEGWSDESESHSCPEAATIMPLIFRNRQEHYYSGTVGYKATWGPQGQNIAEPFITASRCKESHNGQPTQCKEARVKNLDELLDHIGLPKLMRVENHSQFVAAVFLCTIFQFFVISLTIFGWVHLNLWARSWTVFLSSTVILPVGLWFGSSWVFGNFVWLSDWLLFPS